MHTSAHHTNGKSYLRLAAMTLASFFAMYVLMYAMVDKFANAIPNWNQFYMAGLMAAAMTLIEVVVMRGMYDNKKWNVAILIGGIGASALFWIAIRSQTAIGDEQFLKSMIPHHAAAILMCNEAPISDAEIRQLCGNIVSSQQQEIDQMRAILERMK